MISFLNAFINLPDNGKITEVEIINPYQLGKLSILNSTILDVKAKDEKGNLFIVEMQVAEYDFFHKRILYYTSQSYVSQLEKGIQYEKLKPVYFIGILDFEIGNNPNYLSRHKVLDVETKEQVIADIEFNFIELPKFKKDLDELETSIDQWTYFIKNAENLTVIPENVLDEGLKEAYIEADEQNWTKLELDDYLRVTLREQDDKWRFEFALKKAVNEAVKEAVNQAVNEAVKEAELETEARSVHKIAKALKLQGLSAEIIQSSTGLSMEEIEKL